MSGTQSHANCKAQAHQIFLHALKEANIPAAFERHVQASRGVLRVGEDLYQLEDYSRIFAVAFGKAAHTMARELRAQLGIGVSGIVSGPTSNESQVEGFRYFAGGHPQPNQESLRAADATLKALASLGANSLVLYLISGGGSAMIEKPIDDEISLADLAATHELLVRSGAPIGEVNVIRKHLSAVKGGRLAKAAAKNDARQVSIMVSDVPEGSLDALASGPTMPDNSTVEDCYRIAEQYRLTKEFPGSVRELFEREALEETPDKDDPLFYRSRWWPILSNANVVRAAAAKANELGFAVEIDNSCDDWEYEKAAEYLLGRLRELRKGVSRICLISGGEVTVKMPERHGMGGRNQQFALYCASKIKGENITIFSAGTDGVDGNTAAAGAVVDGETMQRGSSAGKDLSGALKGFDAHPIFSALGDAITTGPTGNNLRDLRILMAY